MVTPLDVTVLDVKLPSVVLPLVVMVTGELCAVVCSLPFSAVVVMVTPLDVTVLDVDLPPVLLPLVVLLALVVVVTEKLFAAGFVVVWSGGRGLTV